MGDWVWNPADFAIYGAGIPLLFSVVGWPMWRLFRIARRRYPDRTTTASSSSGTSDGVLDRKELPFEAEALGQPLRERLHAEPLGRVVAARDEVDPELACGLQARLLRLAGEEEVVALVRRADQLAAGAA